MEYGKYQEGLYSGVDQKALVQLALSGFADFGFLDISGWSDSDGDDIELAEVFGTEKLFRAVKSTQATAGTLYVKTLNHYNDGYVPYPMAAREKDNLLTPITHIRKSGSISGVIVFWQNIG
jgi:hypothetical protein